MMIKTATQSNLGEKSVKRNKSEEASKESKYQTKESRDFFEVSCLF